MSTILVVDDDTSFRSACKLLLKAAGFSVITGANGREAVRLACSDRPDVIVMDVDMPILDGTSALAEIKQQNETQCTPVVMVSGSRRDEQKSLALGASHFVAKPLDGADLLSIVRELIEKNDHQ